MNEVVHQYGRDRLFEAIRESLARRGIHKPTRADLSYVDEFHLGGAGASRELAAQLHVEKNMQVLDLGCGTGGASRMFADDFACQVTGIDLNAEYVRTAQKLSALAGMEDKVHFQQADALHLPFPDHCFHIVWSQHVQMNISDKWKFYSEIRRVLVQGGQFAFYDVFKKDDKELHFPVPWADNESISFLITRAGLEEILQRLQFSVRWAADWTDKRIGSLQYLLRDPGLNPLVKEGMQILMGKQSVEKLANLLRNLSEGRVDLHAGIYSNIP